LDRVKGWERWSGGSQYVETKSKLQARHPAAPCFPFVWEIKQAITR
jgi:hypothetical protein